MSYINLKKIYFYQILCIFEFKLKKKIYLFLCILFLLINKIFLFLYLQQIAFQSPKLVSNIATNTDGGSANSVSTNSNVIYAFLANYD